MRVLVNAISARLGGGLTVISHQLAALAKVRHGWSIVVLAAPWNSETIGRIRGVEMHVVRVDSLATRLAFEQIVLPLRFARSIDVVYCPGNFMPLWMWTPCVVAEQNPHYFGAGKALLRHGGTRLRLEAALARHSVMKAEAVVLVSESIRQEIERDGLASSKCTVILNGGPTWGTGRARPRGLLDSRPFFLSLANDSPHKRLDDVVGAWGSVSGSDLPGLVMAGRFSTTRIAHQRSLVSPQRRPLLQHLGAVESRAEVDWLLEHATALVIASQLESFGLTALEAGALGCPLILTDIPAHREVASGHGTFFSVGHVDELRRCLEGLLDSPPARRSWLWPVSWDDNAEQLATVLESVATRSTG
jgi:glycosyltransferase involved in cell wall biosynthesis